MPQTTSVALFDCPHCVDEFRFDLEELQNSTADGSAFVAPAGGAGEPRELHVAPMFEYTTYDADQYAHCFNEDVVYCFSNFSFRCFAHASAVVWSPCKVFFLLTA